MLALTPGPVAPAKSRLRGVGGVAQWGMLSVDDLHGAFDELGRRARDRGKVIDIAVYGGSALMLASNFRISTQDVDAVAATDQGFIDMLARDIGRARDWPDSWLNDGVRAYLSPAVDGLAQHHALFRSYPEEAAPGLRVFVPTAEYLLAMKLMAMRIDPGAGKSDLGDILNLLDIVAIKERRDLLRFARSFYPEARVSPQVLLGIDVIWKERELRHAKAALDPGDSHGPPTYLGRSGPAPE